MSNSAIPENFDDQTLLYACQFTIVLHTAHKMCSSRSSFAMAAQRNRDRQQSTAAPRVVEEARLGPKIPYKLYDDPREDMQRRFMMARASSKMRILSGVSRTMERQVPLSGSAGFRGSVDDLISPPTLYEWMQAAMNGEAFRWEATSAEKPRCVFCNERHTNMHIHLAQHAESWRRSFFTPNALPAQGMVGILFYVALYAEHSGPALTAQEEESFCRLLEVHNHLSFAQPNGPFPILLDNYAPLANRAAVWAKNVSS